MSSAVTRGRLYSFGFHNSACSLPSNLNHLFIIIWLLWISHFVIILILSKNVYQRTSIASLERSLKCHLRRNNDVEDPGKTLINPPCLTISLSFNFKSFLKFAGTSWLACIKKCYIYYQPRILELGFQSNCMNISYNLNRSCNFRNGWTIWVIQIHNCINNHASTSENSIKDIMSIKLQIGIYLKKNYWHKLLVDATQKFELFQQCPWRNQ